MGVLFDIFNKLGPGHNEKYYENAVAKGLDLKGIKHKRQVKIDLKYNHEKVGVFYLDFLIENKIILELKTGRRFSKQRFNQVIEHLKSSGKNLLFWRLLLFLESNL